MENRQGLPRNLIVLLVATLTISACVTTERAERVKTSPGHREFVEGVLVEVKHKDHADILVFEEEVIHVHLGPHEVYPGEWNCVRINPKGYVQEVYLGEDWKEQHH